MNKIEIESSDAIFDHKLMKMEKCNDKWKTNQLVILLESMETISNTFDTNNAFNYNCEPIRWGTNDANIDHDDEQNSKTFALTFNWGDTKDT